MNIILYTAILIVSFISYYLAKMSNTEKEFIQCVETGPTTEVDAAELQRRSYYDRRIVIRDPNGEKVPRDRYVRLLVKGIYMMNRGIYNDDIIVAEKIEQEQIANNRQYLQPNDIVWLYIDDTQMDMIRIFERWEGDELVTSYYENGQKRHSSLNHSINQIKGVVRFKM